MSEENKKYIPEGVLLVCDKGTITSQLIANERKITLYGLTQATDKDNVFEKNILSFGACKTLKGPCCFDCVEWSKTKLGSYYLNGEKPLLEHSEAICKVGGGTIKIYLDDYDAEKAVKKNNENPFVAEKISSLLLGIFLTKDLSAIWSLTSDEDTYTEGVGRGFKKGAEGTANFLMEDMWKQETWDAMGNTLVVGLSYIIPSTTPGVDNTSIFLSWLDSMCDTEFVKTKVQLEDAVGKSVDNTIEAYDRGDYGAVGEVVGQTQYMIVEGVVGSKGVGLLAKGVTNTAKVLIGVERLAVLSTKISKLANAIKTGILKVVRVGRKDWMGGKGFFSWGNDGPTMRNKERLLNHPIPQYYDVLTHGYPYMFEPIKGELVDASKLYSKLLDSGYKPGTPIRLISCSTGKELDGAAQQLANLSKAKVVAPTDLVRVTDDGLLMVKDGGHFRIFYPE